MANANRRSTIDKPVKVGLKLSKKQRALLDDLLTPIVAVLI
jgi:hypothetical protein